MEVNAQYEAKLDARLVEEQRMKRLTSMMAFTVLGWTISGGPAMAQTKTVEGERKTVTGTVEAIEASSRTITFKNGKEYEQVRVPESVKAFSNVKIGDRLKFTYYDNVVLNLKRPGDPDVDQTSGGVTRGAAEGAGTVASQRTITATITAIDEKVPSITFSGPNNWSYTSRVEDRKALAKVKVGDKVDITWTTAMLVSLEPAQ